MKRRDFLTASVASASTGIASGLIPMSRAEGFQKTETETLEDASSSFSLLTPPRTTCRSTRTDKTRPNDCNL